MDDDCGQASDLAWLRAATAADPGSLGSLTENRDDIEAYFDVARSENGYLLIKAHKCVIVISSGAAPPLTTRDGDAERVAAAERNGRDPWSTFLRDFFKSFDVGVNEQGRVRGFDDFMVRAVDSLANDLCGQTKSRRS